MKRALFLSPHLDDVVFSCGATLSLWLERGWEATVVTTFTGNVAHPQGFALQCQTSKGIAPEVDYMALRRAEDHNAFAHIGEPRTHHWDFLEAPHRGYDSPPELFAGIKEGDDMTNQLVEAITSKQQQLGETFDAVFVPQGLGNHVDHLHVIGASQRLGLEGLRWYRDTPYAIREPGALPSNLLEPGLETLAISFDERVLERKIAACCAYASQIGFQFGDPDAVRDKLTAFHRAEAQATGVRPYAELFLQAPNTPSLF